MTEFYDGPWCRVGAFSPKRLDNLRPETRSLIGKELVWDYGGTSDDDEPYPGQHRWLISYKNEIDPDQMHWWVPECDIEFGEHPSESAS